MPVHSTIYTACLFTSLHIMAACSLHSLFRLAVHSPPYTGCLLTPLHLLAACPFHSLYWCLFTPLSTLLPVYFTPYISCLFTPFPRVAACSLHSLQWLPVHYRINFILLALLVRLSYSSLKYLINFIQEDISS